MDKENIIVSQEDVDKIKYLKSQADILGITFQEFLLYKTYNKLDNIERLIDNIEYNSEQLKENVNNIYLEMPDDYD